MPILFHNGGLFRDNEDCSYPNFIKCPVIYEQGCK